MARARVQPFEMWLLLAPFLVNEVLSFKAVGTSGAHVSSLQTSGLQLNASDITSQASEASASSAAEKIMEAVDSCLGHRMVEAEMDDWKLVRLNKVRRAEIITRLVRANISVTEFGSEWTDDVATIEATKFAGREAAEEIAHKEFEQSILQTLSGSNLSQDAVKEFAEKMEEMAKMCGDGEGHELVQDELKLLKGNTSLMESSMAHELAVYVEERCQADVLDVDFFVARLGDVSECNELIGLSLMAKVRKEAQKLDFYAKSTLVLHTAGLGSSESAAGQVGHHFVKLLKGTGDAADDTFRALLRNATRTSADHLPTMSRLRLLDLKHFEHVHGFTVEKYCQVNTDSKAAQWVLDSREIQNYVDCLCRRQQPSLLCDAQHAEELETIRPVVMKRLHHAKESLTEAALLEVAERMKSSMGVGLGPCGGEKGIGLECSFCVSGQCMGHGGLSLDAFSVLSTLIHGPSSCVTGGCSACMGVKPADPLMFVLTFGVSQSCNSLADTFTSFNIFASVELCIGGILGRLADAIGWGSCANLATIAYYPFINKMHIALSLPIFIPPPLGVSAGLEVNLKLGDLTPAVYNHCSGRGHGHFNCLARMFEARGVTGVLAYVDVLLGAKIPVLGDIGKWARILSFEVAEEDNSRALAMNKAGVTVEYIGDNRAGGPKCGKTFSNVNCVHYAGNQNYRANVQDNHKGDSFDIYRNPSEPHDPRALCVRRVDRYNDKWGMKLEIACKVDNDQGGDGVLIPVGNTHHEWKCVMPPEPVTCHTWSGDVGHRLGFDATGDSFQISENGGRICANKVHRRRGRGGRRRRRNNHGWGMNLVLECDSKGHYVDYLIQDIRIGSSKTGYRCILPTHDLECDHDAGDAVKRVNNHRNTDTFTIWKSHTNHLCARRTDKNAGWGMDLQIQCKQRKQLWGKMKVQIGSSHHNERCVPEPSKYVRCDDLVANREYRFTRTEKGDSFFVEQRDGHVCARRTDHHEGWGMNLEVECKVVQGLKVQRIGPSKRSDYRCAMVTHALECDWDAGNPYRRPFGTHYGDRFIVWISHTKHLCARRYDVVAGWGMNLRVECKEGVKLWDIQKVHIGGAHWHTRRATNAHCVPEPSMPALPKGWEWRLQCDKEAADPQYRDTHQRSDDHYEVFQENGNVCVRRLNPLGMGWGMDLTIKCKSFKVPVAVVNMLKKISKWNWFR